MKTHTKLFLPIALLGLVLLIDKIALIPVVRDAGRRETTPMENLRVNFATVLERLKKSQKAGQAIEAGQAQPQTAPYIFLGSSRSEIFQALHPDVIRAAPGLRADRRAEFLQANFETRGIVRAADVWLQYLMAGVVVDSGIQPKLLLIELSPEMLNESNPHGIQNRIGINVYDPPELWDLLRSATGELRYDTALRLLFTAYNYSLRPEGALRNLAAGKTYRDNGALAMLMLSQQPSVKPLPADYVDYPINAIPPDQYQLRFVGYTNHLAKHDILKDYRFSPTQFGVLRLLLERLRGTDLPVLFWFPPVHPELAERRAALLAGVASDANAGAEGLTVGAKSEAAYAEIRAAGFPLIDARESELACRYWTDASHLSDRCAPEVLQYLLDAYERAATRRPAN